MFNSISTADQVTLLALACLSLIFLRIRIMLRRRNSSYENGQEPRVLSHVDILKKFIAQGEDVLASGKDGSIDEEVVWISLREFHDSVLLYLLKTMGGASARRLHDHDGFRVFVGGYPATLSDERIRLCRHIETDLRRLHQFLARAERHVQPSPDFLLNDEEEVA